MKLSFVSSALGLTALSSLMGASMVMAQDVTGGAWA